MKQKIPMVIIEKNTKKRQKAILTLLKKQKGQTLILVPEVAMLDEYEHMGTVYHGSMKQSDKKVVWDAVKIGDVQIVIGTQKALFLPFKNLETLVITEEQYESHKLWDQYPRLNGVRAALALGELTGARIIYASSYPSVALRYMIENKQCDLQANNPVEITIDNIPFGFEDRKWKRALPNDAGTKIRAWARYGKKVLVLYNKKDNQKIREALYFRLSKKAKANIALGTTSLLADAVQEHYDRVVWIAPELTMKAIDYRSSERARILAARLQNIAPKHAITVVARSSDLVRQNLEVSDTQWYEKTLKERRLLNLPPYTDLVRLTLRDKSIKKAFARAEHVRTMLPQAFGPYQEKGPKKSKLAEYHILVSGNLNEIVESYQNLPIDSADVDPHRVV